jgi:hypothetical protein
MTDYDDTEILSDEQIHEGPAHVDDRPWRERLATSQARQDLVSGVRDRWSDADFAGIESTFEDPDQFVSRISEATGLSIKAVEDELDEMTRS